MKRVDLYLIGTVALLVGFLAVGCGGHGPTLPSPNAAGEGDQGQPAAPGSLTVRVELDTGTLVEGAQVKVWPATADPDTAEPVATGQTGADGAVTFKDLPAGDYIVRITYENKVEERRPRVPSGGPANVVVIIPTEQPQEKGALQVCCTRVSGEQSEPIVGLEVQVFVESETEAYPQQAAPMVSGTTGDDGCVLFEDLDVGSYLVVAQYEGQNKEQNTTVRAGQTAQVNLQFVVEEETETANLLVTVKRPVEIAQPKEEAVAGATVEVFSEDTQPTAANADEPVAVGTTDEAGRVQFRDLPVGRYRVVATDPNYDDSGQDTITLEPGDNELLVYLPPRVGAMHVCVRVPTHDGGSEPAGSGVNIVVVPDTLPNSVRSTVVAAFEATTGSDGCATIDGLAPGTYTAYATDPASMMSAYAEGVLIQAGKITEVSIVLEEEMYY